MARKGETTWEIKRQLKNTTEVEDDGVVFFRHYALRTDGKLLTKLRTVESDGRLRHDYGWKLAAASTQRYVQKIGPEAVKAELLRKGYS